MTKETKKELGAMGLSLIAEICVGTTCAMIIPGGGKLGKIVAATGLFALELAAYDAIYDRTYQFLDSVDKGLTHIKRIKKA